MAAIPARAAHIVRSIACALWTTRGFCRSRRVSANLRAIIVYGIFGFGSLAPLQAPILWRLGR